MSAADCFIARSDRVAARMIGGEVMIMSGLDSSLFSLNETASILWEAADGVTPLSRIVRERICPVFEVDEATALADARELAQELARHGVLKVSSTPLRADDAGGQS